MHGQPETGACPCAATPTSAGVAREVGEDIVPEIVEFLMKTASHKYLRHDTKMAVEELATRGVYTCCLTLGPNADNYVKRIFGENNDSIVDNFERLLNVFAAITG